MWPGPILLDSHRATPLGHSPGPHALTEALLPISQDSSVHGDQMVGSQSCLQGRSRPDLFTTQSVLLAPRSCICDSTCLLTHTCNPESCFEVPRGHEQGGKRWKCSMCTRPPLSPLLCSSSASSVNRVPVYPFPRRLSGTFHASVVTLRAALVRVPGLRERGPHALGRSRPWKSILTQPWG